MTKLKFLGRGSAFNIKEDNTSAYIIKDNILLLIDCGETVFKSIIKKNLLDNINDIYILITHFHSDHIGSLSSLISYCYYVKNINVNIYYPNKDNLTSFLLLQGNHLNTWKYFDIKDYKNIYILNKLNISYITFIKNTHDKIININKNIIDNVQFIKEQEIFSSYSYIFYFTNNDCIFYSGDSKEIEFLSLLNLCELQITNIKNITIYQDTCLKNGNVHLSLNKLDEGVPEELKKFIYCIHLDCEELITEAKQRGFNVVEVS